MVVPLKILGMLGAGNRPADSISDFRPLNGCVSDGHTACCSISFAGKKPEINEIIKIWRDLFCIAAGAEATSARCPVIYRDEPDRPQPRKDVMRQRMAVPWAAARACL